MVNKKLIIIKDDLKHNIGVLKKEVKTNIIAVLKGDGYGLGIIPLATILKESGIGFFAVSEAGEALTLRGAGFAEESILLLTPQYKESVIEALVKNKITLTVDSLKTAEAYGKICEIFKGRRRYRCENPRKKKLWNI